jgi:hypothetical protein
MDWWAVGFAIWFWLTCNLIKCIVSIYYFWK